MVTAVRGFVHGIHETETLQGTLPTFDWSALGKLVGVLLQRLLNGIELFGDSCGWAERAAGRCMFAAACLSLLPTCCSLTSCATFCMFSGLTARSTAVLTAYVAADATIPFRNPPLRAIGYPFQLWNSSREQCSSGRRWILTGSDVLNAIV